MKRAMRWRDELHKRGLQVSKQLSRCPSQWRGTLFQTFLPDFFRKYSIITPAIANIYHSVLRIAICLRLYRPRDVVASSSSCPWGRGTKIIPPSHFQLPICRILNLCLRTKPFSPTITKSGASISSNRSTGLPSLARPPTSSSWSPPPA